jgi:hypothetical protein
VHYKHYDILPLQANLNNMFIELIK